MKIRTPWHLWAVGALSLLWNLGSAVDFVMVVARAEPYLDRMSDAQRAYFGGLPGWATAAWALGAWGAVAGSVFLLLRSRLAVWAFGLAAAGVTGMAVHGQVLTAPPVTDLMGSGQLWLSAALVAGLVAMLAYARAMTRRGVLR